jgi:HAD superfamily hydrolase (TIGR01458 family)
MSGESFLKDVRGFLFDLDGVLYVDDQVIPGAREAIQRAKDSGRVCRFISNTTICSLDSLLQKLHRLDLPVERAELVTAAYAGVLHLRRMGSPRCMLLLRQDTSQDYAEFVIDEEAPEVIVVGDYGEGWTFQTVNQVFRLLVAGAELVALQKGRFYQVSDGLRIDTGAFVVALEYASQKKATVVGKPERCFFELALEGTNLSPGEVAMIGDDIDSDVGGAQQAGHRGVLVRTGKYRPELVSRSTVCPDLELASVADLLDLL